MYVAFLLTLSIVALVKQEWAETLLKSTDIPPIAGGPGNSKVAGFLTITYVFVYSSFWLALAYQFFFVNEQMDASMLQVEITHWRPSPWSLATTPRHDPSPRPLATPLATASCHGILLGILLGISPRAFATY